MVTIANIVRKLMDDKPFIQECVNKSLINFGALADYLKPAIEKEIGKKVKLLAISMALRRFAEKKNSVPLPKIDHRTDITTKSNLIEYTYNKSATFLIKINSLYKKIDVQKGDFFSINHGTNNVAILCNARYENNINKILSSEKQISKIKNLGGLFMSIPSNYRECPGFFYLLTRELAFSNITIMSISNIEAEVVFVFHEDDISRAHKVLLNLIPKE
ncbi:MAG TPA: hypothetical protein VI564_02205 [Candidatus Nanoarchaeia archaeon]|nr:hypothetical protein [Candidatus Nanoarchaeia archaeon]